MSYATEAERRRVENHEADVVIVGAGIVGCSLAAALGRQGRSVLLLERSMKEPDRIVGELLQPGGVRALKELGLGTCLEGISAVPIFGYNVIYHGEQVPIPYPMLGTTSSGKFSGGGEKNEGRYEGRAFHHGRFITKLREAAIATPNVTVVETTVTELVKASNMETVLGVLSTTNGKPDYYFAPLTVIADGFASKFRKQYHPNVPKIKSKFYGLELIDAKLPVPGYGHVLLGDDPPILLYQIGTHETRILIDIPDKLPSTSPENGGVKGHLRSVVLPSLPGSIRPSFEKALETCPLRSMPNSFLASSTIQVPGVMFLGDSLNMRHPLTGGGMTVAFNDVLRISSLLHPAVVPDLSDTTVVLSQMPKFHWSRKQSTTVINILAQSLYALFAANSKSSVALFHYQLNIFSVGPGSVLGVLIRPTDLNLIALQKGCFRYFQLGLVDGPVSLLAGIVTQPFILIRHFYAVAFLAIWELLRSQPLIFLPFTIIRCITVFITACTVLFPFIISECRS